MKLFSSSVQKQVFQQKQKLHSNENFLSWYENLKFILAFAQKVVVDGAKKKCSFTFLSVWFWFNFNSKTLTCLEVFQHHNWLVIFVKSLYTSLLKFEDCHSCIQLVKLWWNCATLSKKETTNKSENEWSFSKGKTSWDI